MKFIFLNGRFIVYLLKENRARRVRVFFRLGVQARLCNLSASLFLYYLSILFLKKIKFIMNRIITMIFKILSNFIIFSNKNYIFYNNISNYFVNYYI
jgi:hypothetical protein